MGVALTAEDIPTADGVADAIRAQPDDGEEHPGVLVFMDAFGLRPRLEEMASRIAAEGYVVVVPNLFYRRGRAPVATLGDLKDAEGRHAAFDKVRPMIADLTPELAMSDTDSYLAYLAADESVSTGAIGVVGYCMGGALALRTAAHAPERVAAAASFHGGRLATDDPTSPHLQFDRISAEVYVGHADNDASMDPAQQQRVSEALTAGGVRHRTELYEGAPHGFTMADTASFDAAATERHWERLLDLLSRALPA